MLDRFPQSSNFLKNSHTQGNLITVNPNNHETTLKTTKGSILLIPIVIALFSIVYGCHLRYMGFTQTIIDSPLRADANDYFNYAKNLHTFGIYSREYANDNSQPPEPDALRSPGFPLFASLFVSTNPYFSVRQTLAAQTIIQIISFCLLSFIFFKTLKPFFASVASLLIWSFPHFVTINTYYLSESLFTSLLVLSLFFLWLNEQIKSDSSIALCGLLFGLAAITRPVVEYFPIFIFLLVVLFNRRHFKKTLWFLTAAIIPIIGWKIRNLLAIGQISDPTLMVTTIYHGSFPNFMYNGDPTTFGFPYRFDPDAEKVSSGLKATLSIIWDRANKNLLEYITWYTFGKQIYMWGWSIVNGAGDIFIYPIIKSPYLYLPDMMSSRALHYFTHPFWVISGLAGAVSFSFASLRGKAFQHQPLLVTMCSLLIVYLALIAAVTAPFPRYSIPVKWILFYLSIYSLQIIGVWLFKMIQIKKSIQPYPP